MVEYIFLAVWVVIYTLTFVHVNLIFPLNSLFTMSNVLTIMMSTYPYPNLKFFLHLIFKLFVVLMSYELYSQC